MLFFYNPAHKFLFLSRINGSFCNRTNYFSISSILCKKDNDELCHPVQEQIESKENFQTRKIEQNLENRRKNILGINLTKEKVNPLTEPTDPYHYFGEVGIFLNESDTKEVLDRIEDLQAMKNKLSTDQKHHKENQKKIVSITASIKKLDNIIKEDFSKGQALSEEAEKDLLNRIVRHELLKELYESKHLIPAPNKVVNVKALGMYIEMMRRKLCDKGPIDSIHDESGRKQQLSSINKLLKLKEVIETGEIKRDNMKKYAIIDIISLIDNERMKSGREFQRGS